LSEIDAAAVEAGDEDELLAAEQEVLADAQAHREAGWAAYQSLTGDGGAGDTLGTALAAVTGRAPWTAMETRLRSLAAELADAGAELRAVIEAISDDPERLELVRARRRLLADLRRKYGETLSQVTAYAEESHARLRELEEH